MPVFVRLFALQRLFLICLLALISIGAAQALSLPGSLGGSQKGQPQAQEPLGQSLDEVINTLENDQHRTKLLDDLKKLRDTTKKAQPTAEEGVLGHLRDRLFRCRRPPSPPSPVYPASSGVSPTVADRQFCRLRPLDPQPAAVPSRLERQPLHPGFVLVCAGIDAGGRVTHCSPRSSLRAIPVLRCVRP